MQRDSDASSLNKNPFINVSTLKKTINYLLLYCLFNKNSIDSEIRKEKLF